MLLNALAFRQRGNSIQHMGATTINTQRQRVIARFNRVVDELYNGDVSEVAHDLNLNQSTLSRYRSGKITPSSKTLRALSVAKQVSFAWLQGNGGDRIEYDKKAAASPAKESTLPLINVPSATVPGPGSPGFAGVQRATLSLLIAPDRYWLRALSSCAGGHIQSGDYCLIQVVKQRPAKAIDVGKARVFSRKGRIEFDVLREQDITAAVTVSGVLVRVERDIDEW